MLLVRAANQWIKNKANQYNHEKENMYRWTKTNTFKSLISSEIRRPVYLLKIQLLKIVTNKIFLKYRKIRFCLQTLIFMDTCIKKIYITLMKKKKICFVKNGSLINSSLNHWSIVSWYWEHLEWTKDLTNGPNNRNATRPTKRCGYFKKQRWLNE